MFVPDVTALTVDNVVIPSPPGSSVHLPGAASDVPRLPTACIIIDISSKLITFIYNRIIIRGCAWGMSGGNIMVISTNTTHDGYTTVGEFAPSDVINFKKD